MPSAIDLDAYFERIGNAGERTPTLETLCALHLRHTQAIAFENLNPLLRWPVRLDPLSLQQKLVRSGRGGYCFEQKLLFWYVLEALGFRLIGLAARVIWIATEGAVTPHSRMLLRIDLEERPHVADVAFGGLTLTGPLRLEPDIDQATPHEPFRLNKAGGDFVMQARLREDWKALYRFDTHWHLPCDYEASNYYLSTHPDSRFIHTLIAARPSTDRRYGLLNNQLTEYRLNGGTEHRLLTSAAELREALQELFKLVLPHAPELDAVLARVVLGSTVR